MTSRRDPWQPQSLAEINAEHSAMAQWRKTPEGLALRKAFDEFYAEEDEKELQRMAMDLIVACASRNED